MKQISNPWPDFLCQEYSSSFRTVLWAEGRVGKRTIPLPVPLRLVPGHGCIFRVICPVDRNRFTARTGTLRLLVGVVATLRRRKVDAAPRRSKNPAHLSAFRSVPAARRRQHTLRRGHRCHVPGCRQFHFAGTANFCSMADWIWDHDQQSAPFVPAATPVARAVETDVP